MRSQDYSVVTVLARAIDSVSVNGHQYNMETELFELLLGVPFSVRFDSCEDCSVW
jgi:hypothetical protein